MLTINRDYKQLRQLAFAVAKSAVQGASSAAIRGLAFSYLRNFHNNSRVFLFSIFYQFSPINVTIEIFVELQKFVDHIMYVPGSG